MTNVGPLLFREDDHEINRSRGVEEISHPLAPFQFHTVMMGVNRRIDEADLESNRQLHRPGSLGGLPGADLLGITCGADLLEYG